MVKHMAVPTQSRRDHGWKPPARYEAAAIVVMLLIIAMLSLIAQ